MAILDAKLEEKDLELSTNVKEVICHNLKRLAALSRRVAISAVVIRTIFFPGGAKLVAGHRQADAPHAGVQPFGNPWAASSTFTQ